MTRSANSYLNMKLYLLLLSPELMDVLMVSLEVREQAETQSSSSALVLRQVSVE